MMSMDAALAVLKDRCVAFEDQRNVGAFLERLHSSHLLAEVAFIFWYAADMRSRLQAEPYPERDRDPILDMRKFDKALSSDGKQVESQVQVESATFKQPLEEFCVLASTDVAALMEAHNSVSFQSYESHVRKANYRKLHAASKAIAKLQVLADAPEGAILQNFPDENPAALFEHIKNLRYLPPMEFDTSVLVAIYKQALETSVIADLRLEAAFIAKRLGDRMYDSFEEALSELEHLSSLIAGLPQPEYGNAKQQIDALLSSAKSGAIDRPVTITSNGKVIPELALSHLSSNPEFALFICALAGVDAEMAEGANLGLLECWEWLKWCDWVAVGGCSNEQNAEPEVDDRTSAVLSVAQAGDIALSRFIDGCKKASIAPPKRLTDKSAIAFFGRLWLILSKSNDESRTPDQTLNLQRLSYLSAIKKSLQEASNKTQKRSGLRRDPLARWVDGLPRQRALDCLAQHLSMVRGQHAKLWAVALTSKTLALFGTRIAEWDTGPSLNEPDHAEHSVFKDEMRSRFGLLIRRISPGIDPASPRLWGALTHVLDCYPPAEHQPTSKEIKMTDIHFKTGMYGITFSEDLARMRQALYCDGDLDPRAVEVASKLSSFLLTIPCKQAIVSWFVDPPIANSRRGSAAIQFDLMKKYFRESLELLGMRGGEIGRLYYKELLNPIARQVPDNSSSAWFKAPSQEGVV